jgi:hypothetical protein
MPINWNYLIGFFFAFGLGSAGIVAVMSVVR